MSADAKLAQIQFLVAELEKPARSAKTGDSPHTDGHPVRSLQKKIEREFNQIGDESPNSFAASISDRQNSSAHIDSVDFDAVDIERGLDSLLKNHGVKSKTVRDEFAHAFADLAERARSGNDIRSTLAAIKKLIVTTATVPNDIPPLPDNAPLLYKDRPDKSQTVVAFLRDDRWWGRWTSVGALSRPALKKYDVACYDALRVWVQKHGMPADLDIPTKSQVIDRLIASGTTSESDIARIAGAVRSRISRRQARNP